MVAGRPSLKDLSTALAAGLGMGVLALLALVVPLRGLWLLFHAFGWIRSTATVLHAPRGGGWLVLSSVAGIAVMVVAAAVGAPTFRKINDHAEEDIGYLQFFSGIFLALLLVLVPIALLIAWLCGLFWAPDAARHLATTPWFAIPLVAIATFLTFSSRSAANAALRRQNGGA